MIFGCAPATPIIALPDNPLARSAIVFIEAPLRVDAWALHRGPEAPDGRIAFDVEVGAEALIVLVDYANDLSTLGLEPGPLSPDPSVPSRALPGWWQGVHQRLVGAERLGEWAELRGVPSKFEAYPVPRCLYGVDRPCRGDCLPLCDGGDPQVICVAPAQCEAGLHDNGLGRCVHSGACAGGFAPDGNGSCVQTDACPEGALPEGAADCVTADGGQPIDACADGRGTCMDGACIGG